MIFTCEISIHKPVEVISDYDLPVIDLRHDFHGGVTIPTHSQMIHNPDWGCCGVNQTKSHGQSLAVMLRHLFEPELLEPPLHLCQRASSWPDRPSREQHWPNRFADRSRRSVGEPSRRARSPHGSRTISGTSSISKCRAR